MQVQNYLKRFVDRMWKWHLTPSQVRVIVGELNEVSGDKSFRDTVRAMVAALEREEQQ